MRRSPAAAEWHSLHFESLPACIQGAPPPPPASVRKLARSPDQVAEAVRGLQATLGWDWVQAPAIRDVWTAALRSLAELRDVIVHGDLHLGHVFVEAGVVTGVIDWEACRYDWPVWDFNMFGAWNPDFASWPDRLDELRATMWCAYATCRGLPIDLAEPLNFLYSLGGALDGGQTPPEPGVRHATERLLSSTPS